MQYLANDKRRRSVLCSRLANYTLMLLGLSLVSATHARNIAASWDAVSDPEVAAYYVYYGPGSRFYTNRIPITGGSSAEISGLMEGDTYFFAVTAFNTNGLESDFSDEAMALIPVTGGPETNSFISVSGAYSGLFAERSLVSPASAGSFSLTITKRGAYSGRIQLQHTRASFKGKLNQLCRGTNAIHFGPSAGLALELHIGTGEQLDHVFGDVNSDRWTASLFGNRSRFNPRTNPAPWAGKYKLALLASKTSADSLEDDGTGYVRVSPNGHVSAIAKLSDGTRLGQNAFVSQDGTWPMYVSLYGGQGAFIGWLAYSNRNTDGFEGIMDWIKPDVKSARQLRPGFTNEVQASGSSVLK
ncbi:MAG TPA: fibronectin type III domain-containing protein [Candidatus Dormibacteraeota bacterium]|nr:fibronectin type III domain-containing protein [Candidatus Dormibacteraeota bacterium]